MLDHKRIIKLRIEILDLSQADFSEKIGVSLSTYQRFERGESKLTADAMLSIISQFGVRIDWIQNGEEPIFQKDEKKESPDPPSGYLLVEKDELIKMQKRMIELQEQVIEKQAKQNHSISAPSESSISK